jgi:hypothetical protein
MFGFWRAECSDVIMLRSYLSDPSQGFVLLDTGANSGHYPNDALTMLGDRLPIHCFEPAPKTFGRLASHLGGSAQASLIKRDLSHWGIQQNIVETVELRRLDHYGTAEMIGAVDCLKLDVEGHELKALNGAARMISEKRIRFVQFECGAPEIESRTLFKDRFQWLNANYRICRIVYQVLTPIDTYSGFHETSATANLLAIAR